MKASEVNMDDFALKWRFTEEKHTKLSAEELQHIQPYSQEAASELWSHYISDRADQLMWLVSERWRDPERIEIPDCGWGNPEQELQTQKILSKNLNREDSQSLIFFWDGVTAVRTTWGMFLKYWSSFCYPSDDSNVIIFENHKKAIVYRDDRIWIVNRSIEFRRN
jgi:hypothetical protein